MTEKEHRTQNPHTTKEKQMPKEKQTTKETQTAESAVYEGNKLWDEILKAIVNSMPEQLFPLFKEVYGKEYPEGTSIVLLNTETATFREKHLILFLPCTMLRFRPRLRKGKNITEMELTEYLNEVILILGEEVAAGGLTDPQRHDYVRLLRNAADRVFAKHRKLWMGVDQMTAPLIKLPSQEIRELEEKLAE